MLLDNIFFPSLIRKKIKNPIIIVGNPRSGTTFLQRFLVKNDFGIGTQLWQMIYSSVILQIIIKPILPVLEYISPAKHHSTEAHKTSLSSVETDDVGILFRYFDGFFLYGFILCFSDIDLFNWVDPKKRNNLNRDIKWLNKIWKRILINKKNDRIVAKLFSLSSNSPDFLKEQPDAKILYMVREPLNVIPSGLSLVTGVLDKMFGFWDLPISKQKLFISRLYKGLVELLNRFSDDWNNNKIDKSKVMIVHFNKMMNDFDGLMHEIIKFTNHNSNEKLLRNIKITSDKQKKYKSKHKYDLNKFGLSEEKIRQDCKKYYETFIN
tara:strand:- start:250 stop:1215 length:966 start_codon:yes stop_codon:yes gene_type:complete